MAISTMYIVMWVMYSQVDAIAKQIAYPDFIKIDSELDKVYADVSCLIQFT